MTLLQEQKPTAPAASMTGFKYLILDDSAGLCSISADLLHDLPHAPVHPVNQSIALMWDQSKVGDLHWDRLSYWAMLEVVCLQGQPRGADSLFCNQVMIFWGKKWKMISVTLISSSMETSGDRDKTFRVSCNSYDPPQGLLLAEKAWNTFCSILSLLISTTNKDWLVSFNKLMRNSVSFLLLLHATKRNRTPLGVAMLKTGLVKIP